MNILAIDDFHEPGGAQLVLLQQMAQLARRGHSVSLVAPPGGRFASHIASMGLPFLPLELAQLKRDWWKINAVRNLIRQARPLARDAHIIHLNSLWCLTVLGPAFSSAVPTICAVHAFPLIRSKLKRYINYLLRRRVRGRARAIIAVSKPVRKALIAQGYPAERIHVVPNGVDIGQFRVHARLPFDAARGLRIGMVGRLHPGKGQGVLVEACAGLARAGLPFSCTIIGDEFITPLEDLGYKKQLTEMIAAQGLSNQVQLTGFIQDASAALSSFDIIALPSFEESFGMALLEGMAAGCVPIATDVGGIPELIDHGHNGILIPKGDAAALTRTLLDLAAQPQRIADLAANARTAAEQFDLQRTVDRIEEIYRQVIASRP